MGDVSGLIFEYQIKHYKEGANKGSVRLLQSWYSYHLKIVNDKSATVTVITRIKSCVIVKLLEQKLRFS